MLVVCVSVTHTVQHLVVASPLIRLTIKETMDNSSSKIKMFTQ